MAHHKRRRSRRHVRCVLCTKYRDGNKQDRFAASSRRKLQDDGS